ncbi:hypothetical protein [Portibacter lacus]|uniref:Uncharacterized protein n=1 Tax=Portibacter lacus TaxID=1099794 RepID=A0AA37SL09_9BACT|nr:hypothetical protein [Portibacter lacus]GLR16388.1 hypothetical protein GCM10007940_10030 [Portibacter lacus]
MKAAGIRELKKELGLRTHSELMEICLNLAKFKKESKELLTYLLFESGNEEAYRDTIKEEIEERFKEINASSYYYIKKGIRKILRETKKYIRYSKNKETEVELLLYFCNQMVEFSPSIRRSSVLRGLLERELASIKKKLEKLHEDLQYDYGNIILNLEEKL